MLKAVSVLSLALFASQTLASDIRYSFVEGGLAGGTDDERYDYGDGSYFEEEVEYAVFRVRGSVGFGSFFYLPASLESLGYEFEGRNCEPEFCYAGDEASLSRVNLSVGAGLHFPLGSLFDIYGDASLLASAVSIDYDGGFDDDDDDDNDTGHQFRLGLRFQPTDIVEFDLSAKRQDVLDYTADWRALAVQINFTPHIGVGIEAQREIVDESDLERDYVGGYFRFSFR